MQALRSRRAWIGVAALLFICAGAALAARPAWRLVCRVGLQLDARRLWQCALRHPRDESGAPALWLTIESGGIDTLVLRDATAANLRRSPCLAVDPPAPTVIMAHRDTHFRGLRHVKPGAVLRIRNLRNETRAYAVAETEVISPEQVDTRLADKAGTDWVALLTCYPFRYVGPAPQRFLVWARPFTAL